MGSTKEQFHYAFANTLSREESDKAYERYHIPAPGSFVWDPALANFTPGHQDTYVNFRNEVGRATGEAKCPPTVGCEKCA